MKLSEYKPEKIHRVIIKISGEILAGKKGWGFDPDAIESIVEDIIAIKKKGFSIGIVLGAGNIFRGISADNLGIDKVVADDVGMMGTIQNAIVVSNYLKRKNYLSEIYSAVSVDRFAKFYTPSRAKTSLQERKICFFCGGIGNPYFTTDTAAVLRAIELDADLVMKGTKVDGIYTSDPKKDKKAEFIKTVTYDKALAQKLNVMDMTSFSLARENDMLIKVFNVTKKGNLLKALIQKDIGTCVHN